MKTDKIRVNRTTEQPEGIEIEIVKPESELQGGVLSFLLQGMLRDLKQRDRVLYELPDQFTVEHRGEGTFVVSAHVGEGQFYQQPRPIAIVGIRTVGRRFDLVQAELKPEHFRQQNQQQAAAAAAGGDGATAAATETADEAEDQAPAEQPIDITAASEQIDSSQFTGATDDPEADDTDSGDTDAGKAGDEETEKND